MMLVAVVNCTSLIRIKESTSVICHCSSVSIVDARLWAAA
jgi:hypothetical protein